MSNFRPTLTFTLPWVLSENIERKPFAYYLPTNKKAEALLPTI